MIGRRQGGSGRIILFMIALGITAGVLYFFRENPLALAPPTATDAPSATPQPPTVPPRPTPEPEAEAPTYRLFVPILGIYTPIIEIYRHERAWDISYLGNNAGHLEGTTGLYDVGNIVLAGHVERADGQPGIFAEVTKLNYGDLLILQMPEGERHYQVMEIKEVSPDDLSVLYPTDTDRLTLLTCSDYDFMQASYLTRTIVIADRVNVA